MLHGRVSPTLDLDGFNIKKVVVMSITLSIIATSLDLDLMLCGWVITIENNRSIVKCPVERAVMVVLEGLH